MKTLNRKNFPGPQYPTKIIQFGEGNFLRAFIDWQVDLLNEKTNLNAGITVVRPIDTDFPPSLNMQDGLYTTIIRGLDKQGKIEQQTRIIYSINNEINPYQDYANYLALAHNLDIKFIFSNTTEAGINYSAEDCFTDSPAKSYPAKLTQLLFERFSFVSGDINKGFILLPCELIDYNGDTLKSIIIKYARQWALGEDFINWINIANTFCSTLVDRIVTGYPKEEAKQLEKDLGYKDIFLDTAEYFYLFVIQGPKELRDLLHLNKIDLNILVVDDIKPYKERKVAILNGAHTALVPVAYLAGINTVGEAMKNKQIYYFITELINQEIIPVLSLPKDELQQFAKAVIQRFQNPFIYHQLLSIALNSMTKYRTRNLPQLLAYIEKYNKLPRYLIFSLASLILFYRGKRGDEDILLQDDAFWLNNYKQWWKKVETNELTISQLVDNVLSQTEHWGIDLSQIPDLRENISVLIENIYQKGMEKALQDYSGD